MIYGGRSHAPMIGDYPKIENLLQTIVLQKLGKAQETSEFMLGDGLLEYQGSLINHYPIPDNKDRLIREKNWVNNGCNNAV